MTRTQERSTSRSNVTNKVAIWGSFHNGTFGDDLMAVMLAEQLSTNGYEPWVYRLDAQVAAEHEIHSTSSLDELLGNARCCVIGGGAFLADLDEASPFVAALLGELDALNRAVTERNLPVLAISIGGTGTREQKQIPSAVARLFANPLFLGCTVRLPEDLRLVAEFGKTAWHYPDVVLTAAAFWSRHQPISAPRTDLLVQFTNSRKARVLFGGLGKLATTRGVRFQIIQTQLQWHNTNELRGRNDSTIEYTSLIGLLSCLANTNVILTCKLHVGVAALSFGNAFVSLGGAAKTASFLASIDRLDFYHPKSALLRIFPLFASPGRAVELQSRFRPAELDSLIAQAHHHYDFLLEQVSACGGSAESRGWGDA